MLFSDADPTSENVAAPPADIPAVKSEQNKEDSGIDDDDGVEDAFWERMEVVGKREKKPKEIKGKKRKLKVTDNGDDVILVEEPVQGKRKPKG